MVVFRARPPAAASPTWGASKKTDVQKGVCLFCLSFMLDGNDPKERAANIINCHIKGDISIIKIFFFTNPRLYTILKLIYLTKGNNYGSFS